MREEKTGKKIAIVVTSVLMVRFFLVPHLTKLAESHDVTLLLKNDEPEILAGMNLPVRILFVPIERKIDLWQDLAGLLALFSVFRRERFDMVHTLTPKAGLLGIVAAWLARVPVRLHTFQGEIWANRKGFMRWLLRTLDKLVARLATDLNVVSHSERQHLIDEGIIAAGKSRVLAQGSIGGVDLARFRPDAQGRQAVRAELDIADDDIVYLYLGRLNADKGLPELGEAFTQLAARRPDVRLLVVGLDEEGMVALLEQRCAACRERIIFRPYTPTPETMMLAADVLVLPSHREGFGVVIIEAGAVGVPAIASNIYGITDALEDQVTGLLFEVGNPADLQRQMAALADDPEARARLGGQARARVQRDFDHRVVVAAFVRHHDELLARRVQRK